MKLLCRIRKFAQPENDINQLSAASFDEYLDGVYLQGSSYTNVIAWCLDILVLFSILVLHLQGPTLHSVNDI